MKKIVALISLLVLTGCFSEEEVAKQTALVNTKLPPGCVLHDLGEFLEIDRLVVVTCDGTATTTTTGAHRESNGKSSRYDTFSTVRIGGA